MIINPMLQPDQTLYRYVTVQRFEEMLQEDRIPLVTTHKWKDNDPFEGFLFNQYVEKWPDPNYDGLKDSIYCLCFSNDMEKDQIWRSYTPKNNGVRIAVTVSDLAAAFDDAFVLDCVRYRNKSDMKGVLEACLKNGGQNEEQLRDLFFYKLLGFQNDKEVRLLTIDHGTSGNVKKLLVDICDLVKDIRFDPRMARRCYKKHKSGIHDIYKSRGKGKPHITQSSLYDPKRHLR